MTPAQRSAKGATAARKFCLPILVGRVTPCAPQRGRFEDGAHGVTRHGKRMTGLFYDGHAGLVIPTKLRVSNFREPGSGPAVPGYPGE